MPRLFNISFLQRFARQEEGFTSVEWVVIVAALSGFALGTGMLFSDSAAPVIDGIGTFVASIDSPS